ncbi:transposable element Tcb2 transposase [Trichonephila clavipes]|nr:transposable element Tcb2 transposase [Trichonephila clavipes]
MTVYIYRDVILKQHVRLFRGAMDAEFLFMDDNDRPHHANIVDECLQSEDITRMDWPAYSLDLNPIEHVAADVYTRLAELGTSVPRTCILVLPKAFLYCAVLLKTSPTASECNNKTLSVLIKNSLISEKRWGRNLK